MKQEVIDTEEVKITEFRMPEYYPLLPETKLALRQANPGSKRVYFDKMVQPFLTDLQTSLLSNIDIRLKIATHRFKYGEYDMDQYLESRNKIYDLVSSELFEENTLNTQLINYFTANDAYTLLYSKAIAQSSEPLTIDSLYNSEREPENASNNSSANSFSLVSTFDDLLKASDNSTDSDPSGINFKKIVQNLKQIIFVAVYPERPIPASLESTSGGDEDDDLAVEGGKILLTCPISREVFKRPVKNKKCGHTYDYEACSTYMRSSNQCPECGATFSKSDLLPDNIMSIRVQCFKRDEKLAELIKDKTDADVEQL